jgi:hypothetical protein
MPRLHAPETRWFDDFAIGETFLYPITNNDGCAVCGIPIGIGRQ